MYKNLIGAIAGVILGFGVMTSAQIIISGPSSGGSASVPDPLTLSTITATSQLGVGDIHVLAQSADTVLFEGVSSNQGVQMDFTTANTLKILASNGADNATLDVKKYSVGGVLGVSCSSGALTATAVVTNGIVTLCSSD